MARYLLARLATSLALLVAITLFVFVAFYVTPANRPAPGLANNPYRIHGSLPHQYGVFLWNIVRHGDLGRSYADREPVTARIGRAAPVTLSLVVGGLVLWLLIAVPLGLLAALRPRSLLDVAVTAFVLVGISLHPLWLGLTLGFLFGQHWHLLPAAGYCDLFAPSTACGGPAQWVDHLLLPWLTFGALNAALYTLMIRAFVREELGKDYVLAARAKGAGTGRVLRAHVGRNILAPLVAMIGMTLAVALAGVIFVETAFGLPGLGGMLRQSIMRRDLPMTAGIVLFVTAVIVVVNFAADVVCSAVDPRTRRALSADARA
jgi:peptide/nickel transport system permease protein